jgi:phage terminase large subunit-like protein
MTESARAITYIEKLHNPEGTDWAGQPIKLLEWEKDYLRKMLDTLDAAGNPKYEQSLLFVPKKQGKTTFLAALALYLLHARKHQQIKVVAQTKEQAGILYSFVASMIRQDDYLSQREVCRVYKSPQRHILCHESDSMLDVLSSDAVTANGFNASILLYDEICFAQSSELWDAVISGGINRKNLLAIGLSTAGWDLNGFGYQFYERAKAILSDPAADPTFLPVIYEAPMDADWRKIETYLACSPTFREIGDEAVRRIKAMIAAAEKDPSQLRRIRRYHLNQWIGSDAVKAWIGLDKFDLCRGEVGDLTGRVCWAGLDLGAVKDLTALSLLFPPDGDDDLYRLIVRFFMPGDTLAAREKEDGGAQYTEWAKAGWIIPTPGWCTNYDYVRKEIREASEKYQLEGIAIDRMFNAEQLIKQLDEDGHRVIPMGQGAFTIIPAARELENLIERRKLCHDGNPVLRWNIQNCIGVMDESGNIRPSKKKSTGRIDGVYSTINAVAVEMTIRESGGAPGIAWGG